MLRTLLRSAKASVLFVVLLLAVPAFAHSHPVTMLPAADSTVSAPGKVEIHFSEGLEPKFSSITVVSAEGHVVTKETSKLDDADNKHLWLALPALTPGLYTVKWVAAAVDGHRSTGEYKFTVK